MKKLFSGLFYKWIAVMFVYIIAFRALDYVFSVKTPVTFLDVGFLAFVTLWCEQQDKIKREGK